MTSRLLLLVFASLILSASSAFQSDELLQDDDEFVSVGGKSDPDLEFLQPVRTASGRKKSDPDTSNPDSKLHFSLEHAFGDSEFSPAGTFSARLKTLHHGGRTITKLRFARDGFTEEEKELFKKLLKDDDFYRIRIPSNVLSPPGKDFVVSSVKARCLVRESLDEHFNIYMEGVNILAVNYGSAGACQYPSILKFPTKWVFNSYTVLKNGEQAPRTPAFIDELLGGEDGEGEGIKPPERSFWSKYWMYMIPLGLILMNAFTQAMNYEEPSGQQGSQQQQAGARPPNPAVRRR
ncbi:hypothetical protein H6P81_015983 [Aristolochia fimbriata]|uniref:ER membrane protein complex subunit 10 n=1 Tax=Aristolochia fimbriata TaxID=158543 RepID=A0AAV7E7H0_ARIFI|nr:hypothetical protein H6P81_015983 [Aristolochia fimbriata]